MAARVVVAGLVVLGLGVGVEALVPICCRWEPSPLGTPQDGPVIPVDVNPVGSNLPPDLVVTYLQQALDAWNVNGTSFQFVLANVVTDTSQVIPPGRVRVQFEPTGTSGDAGDCKRRWNFFYYDLNPYVSYFEDGTLAGALVRMNGKLTWGPRPDGGSYSQLLTCALVHELGHALGLEHATGPGSVMGGQCKSVLGWDDVATMKEVYGKARAPYRVRLH